jgi:hypothetical protein
MTPSRPTALRLVTRAVGAREPGAPLGLRSWSTDADAIAVLIDAAELDVDNPREIAAQIPQATELPQATRVFVLGVAARGRGAIGWLARAIRIPRATRCTALVARGYVEVGAGADDTGSDLAWGLSSPC